MTSHEKNLKQFNTNLDLASRIALVVEAQTIHGHVNRKVLMNFYGVTQIQAGSLMRDFIHEHAQNIEWNAQHSHYEKSDSAIASDCFQRNQGFNKSP